MKRKDFIKTSLLSGIALSVLPQFAFNTSKLSYEELIGKGNPKL